MKILYYPATFPYSVRLFIILLSLRICLLLSTFVRICDVVVSVVTRVVHARFGIRIPTENKIFFTSPSVGPNKLAVYWLPGLFSWVKLLVHDVEHSHPSSAEVKNQWSYTSTPSVYLHEVDRDNFTFTIFLLFLNYLCIFLHYSLFIYLFLIHLFIYSFIHSFIPKLINPLLQNVFECRQHCILPWSQRYLR